MPELVLMPQQVLRMLVPLMVEPKKLTRLVIEQQKWILLLAQAQELEPRQPLAPALAQALRTALAVERQAGSMPPPARVVPSTWLLLCSSLVLVRCTLSLALALTRALGTAQVVEQKARGMSPQLQLAQNM